MTASGSFYNRQKVVVAAPHKAFATSKFTERSANIYENKGSAWKTPGEAGMYMKTKEVSSIIRESC